MPGALHRHPRVVCAGFGILLSVLLALGIWGPISGILREAHAAETRRLLEAFREPLAAALAQDDDLARIDLLSRLKKLPGVTSAQVESGRLKIQLARSPWQRLRFQCLERIWSGILLMGFCGGLAGHLVQKRWNAVRYRISVMLHRARERHRRSLERLRQSSTAELLLWTRQAMSFSPAGLVLLDPRQRLVAYNREAGDRFHLQPELLGSHWLDLQRSPEWIAALRTTLECPGKLIPMPLGATSADMSLLTFSTPENPAGSTWVTFHSTPPS